MPVRFFFEIVHKGSIIYSCYLSLRREIILLPQFTFIGLLFNVSVRYLKYYSGAIPPSPDRCYHRLLLLLYAFRSYLRLVNTAPYLSMRSDRVSRMSLSLDILKTTRGGDLFYNVHGVRTCIVTFNII